jgi:hypothetical protein
MLPFFPVAQTDKKEKTAKGERDREERKGRNHDTCAERNIEVDGLCEKEIK